MTYKSSEEELHREGDRHLDELAALSEEADLYDDEGEALPGLALLMDRAALWDDEPTHEKWRRGRQWR